MMIVRVGAPGYAGWRRARRSAALACRGRGERAAGRMKLSPIRRMLDPDQACRSCSKRRSRPAACRRRRGRWKDGSGGRYSRVPETAPCRRWRRSAGARAAVKKNAAGSCQRIACVLLLFHQNQDRPASGFAEIALPAGCSPDAGAAVGKRASRAPGREASIIRCGGDAHAVEDRRDLAGGPRGDRTGRGGREPSRRQRLDAGAYGRTGRICGPTRWKASIREPIASCHASEAQARAGRPSGRNPWIEQDELWSRKRTLTLRPSAVVPLPVGEGIPSPRGVARSAG